jgi:hypothetical protein
MTLLTRIITILFQERNTVTIVMRLLKIVSVKQDDERKAYDHKKVPTLDPGIAHKSIARPLNAVNSLNFGSILAYDFDMLLFLLY